MYVRNGGNPISNSDLGREAHWFDGDGMITGVWFHDSPHSPCGFSPHFVNQFVLTDVCISSFENKGLRTPILPSIATLVDPLGRLVIIFWRILRCALIILLSHLSKTQHAIKRISVANTAVLYHDGRALATCESGPPIRVQLPSLETVGWFDGNCVEGEPLEENAGQGIRFGGTGFNSWMREWTTGHPKVDPMTGEMLLFHCNFLPPFIHYSVVPKERQGSSSSGQSLQKLLNAPVPGCSGGKMMHDFGVSNGHTIILDLPLTLSPFNLLKNRPVLAYESEKPARFGVFPRRDPSAVRWFETSACCIFHTANTWDEYDSEGNVVAVNMLACRLTSASLVFSAGNIPPPPHPNRKMAREDRPVSFFDRYDEDERVKDLEKRSEADENAPLLLNSGPPTPPISLDAEEECRLYYYRFDISTSTNNTITHQFALSVIPFEFPTVAPSYEMSFARYIYGCSSSTSSFGAALGKATKIDIILKIDVQSLLVRGKGKQMHVDGSVDTRTIQEVLASKDARDSIKAFALPPRHFAQEARFVPRQASCSEDDGYLLFYVFDETQLKENGECRDDATSELWVLDALDMRTVVCMIHLPTRVPYGLHGNWFPEGQIREQRAVERLRKLPVEGDAVGWGKIRELLVSALG